MLQLSCLVHPLYRVKRNQPSPPYFKLKAVLSPPPQNHFSQTNCLSSRMTQIDWFELKLWSIIVFLLHVQKQPPAGSSWARLNCIWFIGFAAIGLYHSMAETQNCELFVLITQMNYNTLSSLNISHFYLLWLFAIMILLLHTHTLTIKF